MSPLPDVRNVSRQSAGNNEDCIDANVVVRFLVVGRKPLGCSDHAAQAPGIQGHGGSLFGRSRFDLDEGESSSASGNDIDFAAGHASSSRKDMPAAKPQPPAGQRLGSAAALFSRLAVHLERSSARA